MVKSKIKQKTLDQLESLFKEKKKKIIKTRKGILKHMDIKMKECLIGEDKARRNRNYNGAEINEDYFFALFFLRERILGRELNVHQERKRLLKKESKR